MQVMQVLESRAQLYSNAKCAEVRKLCSVFNYESELQKLLDTVKTIKTFLLDADSKCLELTNEGQNWVENLKDAVYDADDLMDEFNTIANMPGANKISKKVRRFFSPKNPMIFAFNTSSEVKKLREKLDSLAKNHSNFGFSDLYKPDVKVKKETCSYVYEQSIIGRDVDKKVIVDLLLKDDLETNISFVTIVGIGGLGKTALAQLVFSDLRIKEAFEENMYWVCVSVNFDTKDILGKILKENNGLGFEDMHKNFRERIEGKRYLLVLDDVWSENSEIWVKLKDFLILGGTGSRILVTSRSKKVARAIGNYPIHELEGLSEEDSWELFKKISLADREDEVVTGLAEIGKDIVIKCANVPLCIRVVASLLRDQDLTAWQSYRRMDLANMRGDDDVLMQTLMFSYYHLDPVVRCCFSFCSVFPQDYRIHKEKLISLWSAHGYLVPSGTEDSIEDVGERYFSILLHRCFFQDLCYECRGVTTFKMHDLIHDLAQKIAGKESLTLTASNTHEVEGKVRHLYIDDRKEYLDNLLSSSNSPSKTLRSCLINYDILIDVNAVISKCSQLRVLDLQYQLTSITLLPDTLGSLLHLRYLDLSFNNDLVMLPKSITKLYNLQTLILFSCENLKELPKDTSKLVNLRVLDIKFCDKLTHMPAGMDTLTCLQTLTNFLVFRDDEVKQDKKGKLVDLKALISKLRGELHVKHIANYNDVPYHKQVRVQLQTFKLFCELESYHEEGQETLLEALFFKHQLPTWASGLVRIYMSNCHELQYLPSSLSQLCHLRKLFIYNLDNVEYIESDAPSPSAKFFPSLEVLTLSGMPKLMGWWRDIRWTDKEAVFIPSFPHLRKLTIQECKRLAYFPPCQHEALKLCMNGGGVQSKPIYLKRLTIDDAFIFNFLSMEYVGIARYIELVKIENLGQIREVLQSCASSLQDLKISYCRGIQNLGLEHLTNLKSLKLGGNLDGIPWESLHSLPSLKIEYFEAGMLPKGIQYLTSLQSLYLCSCKNLEELGECIASLTSLQFLQIQFCRKLKSLPEEMCYLTSLTTLELKYCRELKSLPKAIKHLTNLTKLEILEPNPELTEIPWLVNVECCSIRQVAVVIIIIILKRLVGDARCRFCGHFCYIHLNITGCNSSHTGRVEI